MVASSPIASGVNVASDSIGSKSGQSILQTLIGQIHQVWIFVLMS